MFGNATFRPTTVISNTCVPQIPKFGIIPNLPSAISHPARLHNRMQDGASKSFFDHNKPTILTSDITFPPVSAYQLDYAITRAQAHHSLLPFPLLFNLLVTITKEKPYTDPLHRLRSRDSSRLYQRDGFRLPMQQRVQDASRRDALCHLGLWDRNCSGRRLRCECNLHRMCGQNCDGDCQVVQGLKFNR